VPSVWDWHYVGLAFDALLPALWTTVWITVVASIGAIVLGVVWAVLRYARLPVISQFVTMIIEFLRGTPALVQLYFLFYVLPLHGITLDAVLTGIIGLAVYTSAYCAEVYRAGITAVPPGQWEAARMIGLSSVLTWTKVILPQAWRLVIPPLGNYVLLMFKETTLLSAITVAELMHQATEFGAVTYRYTEGYTVASA
jgi:polar amino acid transport system permease protein